MRNKTADSIIGSERLELHERNTIIGYYKGFQTAMYIPTTSQNFFCTINVVAVSEREQEMIQELRAELVRIQSSEKNIISIRYDEHTIDIIGLVTTRVKNLSYRIHSVYDRIVEYLKIAGFRTGCGCCGSEVTKNDAYYLNERVYWLCEACYQEKIHQLDVRSMELKSQKGSFITGIAGAFLGALIGGVIWVVIAQLGYISALAAMLLGVLTIFGYRKLGGRMNIIGLILSILIMLAMVFVAHNVSYILDMKQAFSDLGKPMSYKLTMTYVKEAVLHVADYREAYIRDLVIGYLVTIIAGVSTAVSIYRNVRGVYHTHKIQ